MFQNSRRKGGGGPNIRAITLDWFVINQLLRFLVSSVFSMPLTPRQRNRIWTRDRMETHCTEAEFMDELQSKVSRVLLLAMHSQLYSLALRFLQYFFKLTQPLTVSTVELLYTVKKKGWKPDGKKPYPLYYSLRNAYRNLKPKNSQDNALKPQRSYTFMN
jgi:hypothetical protein